MNRSLVTAALALACVSLAACSHNKDHSGRGRKSTTAGVTSESYGQLPNPQMGNGPNALTALTPVNGSQYGGTVVTLTGFDFVAGMTVDFGGTPATDVVVTNSTTATCKTGAHAVGLVDVIVVLPSGATGRMNNAFTFDNSGPMARVADHGDPSGGEQEIVELINRARRNPVAEAARLNAKYGTTLDFSGYPARPALSPNEFLSAAAKAHTTDMHTRQFYGHLNPDGVNANGRILATPYKLDASFGNNPAINMTESIGKGTGDGAGNTLKTPQGVHDSFMIDAGLPSPKHRNIALGATGYEKNREIGTSFLNQTFNGTRTDYIDEEFAFTTTNRAFLCGVAFTDANNDGVCQAGEGLANKTVTLTHASGFSIQTTTKTAGGYSFEVFVDGTYTLTIDGKSQQVTIGADTVKVDLKNAAIQTY